MIGDIFIKNKISIFILCIGVFFGFSNGIFAQEVGINDVIKDQLLVPKVDLEVTSGRKLGKPTFISAYTSNINNKSAEFLWYVDDEYSISGSGVAKNNFSFVSKKNVQVVKVVIMDKGKKIAENSILVNSYNISLVWSVDTYVPPEYPGKALPTRESRVSVVVIPDMGDTEVKDLVFTWYIDAKSYVRKVRGRDEFSFFVNKNQDSITVSVEVSTLSGSISLVDGVAIPIVRPSVVVAYKNPEEKTSYKYMDTVYLSPGDNVLFKAFLYNFRAKNDIDFDYVWEFLGTSTKKDEDNSSELSFSVPEDSFSGKGLLTLSVVNKNFFKERAREDISVNIMSNKK